MLSRQQRIGTGCALLALLACTGFFSSANSQSTAPGGAPTAEPWTLNSGTPSGKLHGKVTERSHPVRLARPGLPPLGGTVAHDDPLGDAKTFGGSFDSNSAMFLKGMKGETDLDTKNPLGGGTDDDTLKSEAENDEMIIAWEEWHKRVSEKIYELWRRNGTLPGTCYATLVFTRNFHVEVTIREVELDPMITERMPDRVREFQDEFAREVRASVEPLNGAVALQFPEKSHREQVSFTPAFRGTNGPAGYSWRKDDFERVQTKSSAMGQ